MVKEKLAKEQQKSKYLLNGPFKNQNRDPTNLIQHISSER